MKQAFTLCFFDAADESEAASENTAETAAAVANEVGTRPVADATELQPQPTQVADGKSSATEQMSYKQFKEHFKEQYQADLQKVIDKRFKNAKKVEAQRDELLQQSEAIAPLMRALEKRFGTNEPELLINNLSEQEDAGTAPTGAPQANADAPEQESEARQTAALLEQQAIVQNWQQQAQELVALYPEFDLAQEVDNERFCEALQNGMTVRDAYQHAHFDEILSGVIHYTADNVKSALAKNKAVRTARAVENGAQGSAGSILKSDVSKLSKEEMEEIDRLVFRGEKISF